MRQLLHPFAAGDLPAMLPVAASTIHRLERVLRLPAGAPLILNDGRGRRVEVRWRGAHFEVVGAPVQAPAAERFIELAAALIKGERFDWLVEKCTELGVDRLVPLQTDHCVVQLDARRGAEKAERWRAIARESLEQCGRDCLPEISTPTPLLRWLGEGQGPLFHADERGAPVALAQALTPGPGQVRIVIGPEGGLSVAERLQIEAVGGQAVTLGRNVLRAETAAIFAVGLARNTP